MPNLVDRVIGYFSPARAAGRLRAREALEFAAQPEHIQARNVWGLGSRPHPKLDPELVPDTEAGRKLLATWTRQLKRRFRYWAKDAGANRETFNQLLRLVVRCWRRDGDVFLVASHKQRR